MPGKAQTEPSPCQMGCAGSRVDGKAHSDLALMPPEGQQGLSNTECVLAPSQGCGSWGLAVSRE